MGEIEEKGGELGPEEKEGRGRPPTDPVTSWQGPDTVKEKDEDSRHVPDWARDVDMTPASLGKDPAPGIPSHAAQITRERAVRLAVERAIKTGMTPEQADDARKHAARKPGEPEAAYAARIKALLGPGGELHNPSILDDGHVSRLLSMLGIEAPQPPPRPTDGGPGLAGIEEAIRQKNAEIAASLRKTKGGQPSSQDIAELESLKAMAEKARSKLAEADPSREAAANRLKGIGGPDEKFDLDRALAEFRKKEAARRKSGPATDKKSQPGGQ
jgi:hypothetical protein